MLLFAQLYLTVMMLYFIPALASFQMQAHVVGVSLGLYPLAMI